MSGLRSQDTKSKYIYIEIYNIMYFLLAPGWRGRGEEEKGGEGREGLALCTQTCSAHSVDFGGSLGDLWEIFWGSLWDLWWIFSGSLGDLFGDLLGDIWEMFGGFLGDIWGMFG